MWIQNYDEIYGGSLFLVITFPRYQLSNISDERKGPVFVSIYLIKNYM